MQERYGILQDLDYIVIMLQSWIFFNSCKSFSFLISTIETILAWLWFAKIPIKFSSYFNCISQASQIACTVTTIYVTYTQTAWHIRFSSALCLVDTSSRSLCCLAHYLDLRWFFLFERRNADNVKCLSLTFKYFTAFK